ncbi:MAG: response regulator [Myxococcota bacterium]|nr:response regulator [Myxococcota bacterium]
MPTALIVDDSPIMRGQLRRVLSTAGFTIAAEAGTANELLELYERHTPDLVTLDIVMPGRDGAAAAAELLAKYPRAVVVMCTSLTARDKILACQKAGVSYFLLKPFEPENAVAIFRSILERARAAQAAHA